LDAEGVREEVTEGGEEEGIGEEEGWGVYFRDHAENWLEAEEEAWQIRHRARFLGPKRRYPTALPFISIGGLTGRCENGKS